ncbi:MAG: ribonuclease HI [Desulfobacterales bacterium]|nr:ribonuclease HI [Desulfobacterales bacterium]
MKEVTIYTDGSSKGNPGPGGYGAILIYKDQRKELSEGFRFTTNNRMELLAVIEALNSLKYPCKINLYSDSKYVIDAFNKGWLRAWKSNGWMKKDKTPVLNSDLWKKLIKLTDIHDVKFIWVKGHADNIENERCDLLAVNASKSDKLSIDEVYENTEKRNSSYTIQTFTAE